MPLRMNNARDRPAETLFVKGPDLLPFIKRKAGIARKKPRADNGDMRAVEN